MNLIIDNGNSKCKVAIFQGDKMIENFIFNVENLEIKEILGKYKIDKCIFSSVGFFPENKLNFIKENLNTIVIDNKFNFPFISKYKTPKTLGIDRKILTFGASQFFPKKNNLIIDMGSCITYDIITEDREYLGGGISAGIDFRFKAMNKFTKSLPVINKENEEVSIIGNSTEECLKSGTINGVLFEIEGFINHFRKEFQNTNIIITGGDSIFLKEEKNSDKIKDYFFLLKSLNKLAEL